MTIDQKFSPAEAEDRIYDAWEKSGAFAAGANAKDGAESFCIVIPPPNVTGSLHIGHALNNTLQDILIRWKRMQGFDVLWQPGQDHAGIATQMVVERNLNAEGKKRTDFSRPDFIDLVWKWKAQSGGTIMGQLKRLGASCDWSRNAFTMSGAPGAPAGEEGNLHDAVLKVFVDLYDKGLIYRGKRLVNWDPKFETAISDLEVENTEVDGHMWHFKYPLAGGATYEYVEKDEDGNVTLRETRDYISIATTRPETMLGDGAVAVHPDDERYAPIVGKLCEIPVGPKEHRRLIPIITDEYPDPDFGSGAVKITGAHDFNDYAVAKRGGIPCYRLMDTKAAMRADGAPYADAAKTATKIAGAQQNEIVGILEGAGFRFNRADNLIPQVAAAIDAINLVPDEYRGLDRYEARKQVVEAITAEGLAVMCRADDPRLGGKPPADEEAAAEIVPLVERNKMMQPFGDRSKVVIEPMLTDQWFVDAATLAKPALEAVKDGRTKFVPSSWEKTYFHWLENIEPWCISRQLWWGHQIPVWYDLYGNQFCAASEAEAVELAKAHHEKSNPGKEIEIVRDESVFVPTKDSSGRDKKHPKMIESGWVNDRSDDRLTVGLYRDPDVLDTWFSSALWPYSTLGWPEKTPELEKYYKTDVLITGNDIIFFWVARMMMTGIEFMEGEVPFHTVYINSIVTDAKGKKMSKSIGNVIDPLELIDQYGADAVRYTLASQEVQARRMLKLAVSQVEGGRNFGTKIWNAAKFGEMNECRYDADFDPRGVSATVNKWIVGETAKTRIAVDKALAEYRFNDAATTLYAHIWGVFCDWYLEFSKPLLNGEDAAAKAETQATFAWARDQFLTMLHPIMPFITEELWGALGTRAKPLIHSEWPTYGAEMIDAAADAEMAWVIGLIEQVRSVKALLGVKPGAKLPLVVVEADATARARLSANAVLIGTLGRIESVADGTADKGSVTLPVEGAVFALPLAGEIDVEQEKARLEKSAAKAAKEVGGLKGKLGNEKFLANAPDEVVEEQRERLVAAEAEQAKLEAALSRLAEMG